MHAGAASTAGSQRPPNPPWVQRGATSMRLVQKAAEMSTSAARALPHWQQVGLDRGQQGSHAGFEEAPWMGLGGVHHMDPGHLGRPLHQEALQYHVHCFSAAMQIWTQLQGCANCL